ncbi:MAG: hypothetical protein ACI8ZM_003947 [Crocinitomix sp.]|jgi:hypothetical protein
MLPLILIVILIVFLAINKGRNEKSNKRNALDIPVKCTGCAILIEGRLIRITGPELTQPLHYCSEQCKLDHIDRDIDKFADIEVI